MNQVLVLNAGSSSLKFQVMNMDTETVLAKGLCERIGLSNSVIQYRPNGSESKAFQKDMPDHFTAIQLVFELLTSPEHGVIGSMDEITAVGHRSPHGGEVFDRSVLIDDEVLALIRANTELAPIHTPPILLGMEACRKLMPNTPMAAVFDTAFHQTMPEKAYLYALPYEDYEKFTIRRFGFHGTSHRYVAARAAALMNRPIEELKIISCHLGNGSSVCAIDGGKSVDTSMGFTPLEGLPMGTRSGNLDPAIPLYLMKKKGWNADETEAYLLRKSGLLGLSGISSDFRDLREAVNKGDQRAKLALDVFAYAIRKYIGAYAAAMEGVDCVIFTGGIGENAKSIREMSISGLDFMGLSLDPQANASAKGESRISTSASRGQIWVIPTDEELVIARDALALAKS